MVSFLKFSRHLYLVANRIYITKDACKTEGVYCIKYRLWFRTLVTQSRWVRGPWVALGIGVSTALRRPCEIPPAVHSSGRVYSGAFVPLWESVLQRKLTVCALFEESKPPRSSSEVTGSPCFAVWIVWCSWSWGSGSDSGWGSRCRELRDYCTPPGKKPSAVPTRRRCQTRRKALGCATRVSLGRCSGFCTAIWSPGETEASSAKTTIASEAVTALVECTLRRKREIQESLCTSVVRPRRLEATLAATDHYRYHPVLWVPARLARSGSVEGPRPVVTRLDGGTSGSRAPTPTPAATAWCTSPRHLVASCSCNLG